MTPYIVAPILIWILIMTVLLIPTARYTSAFDRITKAKWRKDREGLDIMLSHITQFPEEWSIKRGQASFPKEGSKQIMLDWDKSEGHWTYALSSFGGNFRPLNGYFAKKFEDAIETENNRRESEALIRQFYPELNGQLLLGQK